MTRIRLGALEQEVLLAMLRIGDSTNAVAIMLEIQERTGREITHASVYVALRRMESRGLLASHIAAPVAGEKGRPRRLFSVNESAIDALRAEKRALSRLWDGIDALEEV